MFVGNFNWISTALNKVETHLDLVFEVASLTTDVVILNSDTSWICQRKISAASAYCRSGRKRVGGYWDGSHWIVQIALVSSLPYMVASLSFYSSRCNVRKLSWDNNFSNRVWNFVKPLSWTLMDPVQHCVYLYLFPFFYWSTLAL